MLDLCDGNLKNKRRKVDKENEGRIFVSEKAESKTLSGNLMLFDEITRFNPHFSTHRDKICTISMLVNLFCRLNFKGLTHGVE